ncbi:MAG: methyl-accepting chemotaxis protein [Geopsychrobacter sp.]|nr:methyl-accepting chemotaxis protein [Geopsychrobacter sp.]
MKWGSWKIGTKLAIGFGCMLLLIGVSNLVGYQGVKKVDHALIMVSDEEAPVLEATTQMQKALVNAMRAMDDFMMSTSALATDDVSRLAAIEQRYNESLAQFDQSVTAITKGGKIANGQTVIATDNPKLGEIILQADSNHDQKFQVAARELMAEGKALLQKKAAADKAMAQVDSVTSEVATDAGAIEKMISKEISNRAKEAGIGAEALAILREEVPLADMANEIKYALAASSTLLDEFVAERDPAKLTQLEAEFVKTVATFDSAITAILKGGSFDGTTIFATDNAQIRASVEEIDGNHEIFQKNAAALMAAHRDMIAQAQKENAAMARLDQVGETTEAMLNRVKELSIAEMEQAKTNGRQATATSITILISVAAGALVLGVLLGFAITRSITKPLKKVFEVVAKYGKGDTSDRNLNIGEAVNCSSLKNCGQTDCQSYGKEGNCWTTTGSFGPTPTCFYLTNGSHADCRECKAYRATNELTELGSVLVGMANSMQGRSELAEAIASGDLTRDVKLNSQNDQLGKALKTMLGGLREMVSNLQVAGEQIASGSGQVSDAAQSLSQGATESAASLEEVTSSMTEMSSQVAMSAENANQANVLSTEAQNAAETGNSQMTEMVEAMSEINSAGQNISKIIKVIDEIAFQTNLLALNAAVEAARAGQHGKGFAVVAEEVRNLAARSAKAAEETAELIEGSVELTARGSQIASQTAEALSGITGSTTKVSDLLEEIAAASNEQAQGIAQVSQGLSQIDQVTQQNTATAEESAAASEELSGQALQMQEMLKRFTLNQSSSRGQGTHFQPAPSSPSPTQASQAGWSDFNQPPNQPAPQIALEDSEFGKF